MQRMERLRRAKLVVVRYNLKPPWLSSLWADSFDASSFSAFEADEPEQAVHGKEKWTKTWLSQHQYTNFPLFILCFLKELLRANSFAQSQHNTFITLLFKYLMVLISDFFNNPHSAAQNSNGEITKDKFV